jgi:hypothetical protein
LFGHNTQITQAWHWARPFPTVHFISPW